MVTKTKTPARNAGGKKPAPRKAAPGKSAARPGAKRPGRDTGAVLSELKSLARELNKAAKGLSKKRSGNNPKDVSTVLGNVERMTAEAATKSLIEAEDAKLIVARLTDSLGRDWSRKDIEASLKELGGHLTNIIVAQEFQDLAGQSIRHALKALVGAIIVTEGGGPTEEGRLSQTEVDSLLKGLLP
jgi:chemotaxis regulatin CheY-phosphate phosphatase CheZ